MLGKTGQANASFNPIHGNFLIHATVSKKTLMEYLIYSLPFNNDVQQ